MKPDLRTDFRQHTDQRRIHQHCTADALILDKHTGEVILAHTKPVSLIKRPVYIIKALVYKQCVAENKNWNKSTAAFLMLSTALMADLTVVEIESS